MDGKNPLKERLISQWANPVWIWVNYILLNFSMWGYVLEKQNILRSNSQLTSFFKYPNNEPFNSKYERVPYSSPSLCKLKTSICTDTKIWAARWLMRRHQSRRWSTGRGCGHPKKTGGLETGFLSTAMVAGAPSPLRLVTHLIIPSIVILNRAWKTT